MLTVNNGSPYLVVGDLHLSSRQIESRVDTLSETSLLKLHWLVDTAIIHKADIVCTGDFAHTVWAGEFRYRVKTVLRKLQSANLAFYVVYGNHDFQDGNLTSGAHTELGQLIYDGYLTVLDTEAPSKIVPGSSTIVGIPAYTDLNALQSNSTVIGAVCHHYIMAGPDNLVVDPAKLKAVYPNLRYLIAGHDHTFYSPAQWPCGVTVIRPGSFIRTSIVESSNRIPCVYLIDFDHGVGEPIPCKVARPYSEVFMVGTHGADTVSKETLTRFSGLMARHDLTKFMDLPAILRGKLDKISGSDRALIEADLVQSGFEVS